MGSVKNEQSSQWSNDLAEQTRLNENSLRPESKVDLYGKGGRPLVFQRKGQKMKHRFSWMCFLFGHEMLQLRFRKWCFKCGHEQLSLKAN